MTYPVSIFIANEFIILKRGDNDSFGRNGIIRRLEIAIIQWTNAISLLKLDPVLEGSLLKKVHSDIGFFILLYRKQLDIKTNDDLTCYESIVTTKYSAKSFSSWILLKTPISKILKFLFMILLKLQFDKLFKLYRIYFKF